MTPRTHWLDFIRWQIGFYAAAVGQERTDGEFAWGWFEARFPHVGVPVVDPDPFSPAWVTAHVEPLWEARGMLGDDTSRLLFDAYLVIRAAGHRRFYVPRLEFEDLIVVHDRLPFTHADLPADYLGLPLSTYDASLAGGAGRFRFVSTELQVLLTNAFRQYLPTREGLSIAPRHGDVVLDCGACIGEFSLLFAELVGSGGQVHLFDPVPLHLRYCRHQAELNPDLAPRLHMNRLAVGDRGGESTGTTADVGAISPGGLRIDTFTTTTLDDYAAGQGLEAVGFVKMDIEGAEPAALAGASRLIATYRPRLAISAYHRPEHLWEIPRLIRALRPDYRLCFGHHTPIRWECVYYAV